MSFTYDATVPNGTHSPSQDYQAMQTNYDSIQNGFSVNHVGFNEATCGQHTIINLERQSATSANANQGLLYAAAVSTDSELFYARDGGEAFQVTNGTPVKAVTGITSLPGGMLMAWDKYTFPDSGLTITVSGLTVIYNCVVSSTSYLNIFQVENIVDNVITISTNLVNPKDAILYYQVIGY